MFIFIISCSSGSADSEQDLIEQAYPKVTNNNGILSISDFKSAGFKTLREYKTVEEVPLLSSAFHGIFKKMDYELRFYNNHQDALNQGSEDANLVSC